MPYCRPQKTKISSNLCYNTNFCKKGRFYWPYYYPQPQNSQPDDRRTCPITIYNQPF